MKTSRFSITAVLFFGAVLLATPASAARFTAGKTISSKGPRLQSIARLIRGGQMGGITTARGLAPMGAPQAQPLKLTVATTANVGHMAPIDFKGQLPGSALTLAYERGAQRKTINVQSDRAKQVIVNALAARITAQKEAPGSFEGSSVGLLLSNVIATMQPGAIKARAMKTAQRVGVELSPMYVEKRVAFQRD